MASIAERVEGLIDKIPRFAEMLGVAILAGKASERLGADFGTGALGGVVADGLAHSRLPNNQLGGLALGAYFSALGALTVAPKYDDFVSLEDIGKLTFDITKEECASQGGVWIEGIHGTQGACRLPS